MQRAHEQRAALSRMVQLTEASERDLAAQGLMGAGAGGAEPGMTGSSGPRGSKGGSVGCAGIAGWRAGLAASLPPCRDAMLRGHAMAAETGGAGAVAGGVATVEGGAPAAGCVSGPGPHLRLELVAAVQGCRGGLWVVQVGGGDRCGCAVGGLVPLPERARACLVFRACIGTAGVPTSEFVVLIFLASNTHHYGTHITTELTLVLTNMHANPVKGSL